MVTHLLIISAIMLLAGCFGGMINYQLANGQHQEQANFARSVSIGIGAALLVPMGLELISSPLIMSSSENPAEIFTFLGLCLIAALASRFITTPLSQQTLQTAQAASRRAEALERELQQIQSGLSPLLLTKTEDALDEVDCDNAPSELLDVISVAILQALTEGKHLFRSLSGIAQDAEQEEATAKKFLSLLQAKGLVGRTNSPKGVRWFVTENGRRVLSSPRIME